MASSERQRGFAGEVDAAHLVDFGHLNLTSSPMLTTSSTLADPVGSQLGDVDEPFLARQNLDESAEVHDALDRAGVDLADLDLFDELSIIWHGLLRAVFVGRRR